MPNIQCWIFTNRSTPSWENLFHELTLTYTILACTLPSFREMIYSKNTCTVTGFVCLITGAWKPHIFSEQSFSSNNTHKSSPPDEVTKFTIGVIIIRCRLLRRCLLIPLKKQTCPAENSNTLIINFMLYFRPVESINDHVPLSNYMCSYLCVSETKIRHQYTALCRWSWWRI